jgi:hypothetical protein
MEISSQPTPVVNVERADETMTDDSEERRAHHNRTDAAALFGQGESPLSVAKVSFMEHSPMIKPQFVEFDMAGTKTELHEMSLADDFSAFICETVEMDELDDLFTNY